MTKPVICLLLHFLIYKNEKNLVDRKAWDCYKSKGLFNDTNKDVVREYFSFHL